MRLGIIGTMVWDRIFARDGRTAPVEEWGGISYALAALSAARPGGWELVPLLKLGRDLEPRARAFLAELPGLDLAPGVFAVPEPNNRVELRYQDRARRCERLTGGVPPWTWDELRPLLEGLDALYLNFISGFELALLAHAWGDPWRFAAQAVGPDLRLLLVTLGERGAAYFASSAFTPDPLE